MILVGNQRGGAKDLAQHLLKEENDHVQVHELRGFVSDNLIGALNESYAVSRGTRCKQFLYSLSINPPPDEQVSTADFEAVIDRAEVRLGLTGQPRAVVFHEKAGTDGLPRRHAHAVWSRIKTDEMKAVQISHDRHKLTDLSRELYREHGFKMPRGLMRSAERDPRNFTLEDWQKAKRNDMTPPQVRQALEECWSVSDSRASFEHALQSRGFKLARGDKRGFVAVDMNGAPYSVPKFTGVRTKLVRDRLGDLKESYPGVEARKAEFAAEIDTRLRTLREQETQQAFREKQRYEAQRRALVEQQRAARAELDAALRRRWQRESAARQERFSQGWKRLLDHLTGRQKRIREQNIAESYQAILRDRAEKDALVFRHMDERRELHVQNITRQRAIEVRKLELDADLRNRDAETRPELSKPQQSRIPDSAPLTDKRQLSSRSDFMAAAQPPSVSPSREQEKEAFVRERKAQTPRRTRHRGPTLDR